ncbi:hypothetical protein [Bifidobacterium sp.]|uniref:hypothetical protein n=1 Tax=Bifidobacterium sp. TaxID=41200 RepID=UPI0025C61B01|nr:hypothetical protein [Bifidobacterium sp.]MCI1635200.1 hypothetical protein [Bifidobacterium sp.]
MHTRWNFLRHVRMIVADGGEGSGTDSGQGDPEPKPDENHAEQQGVESEKLGENGLRALKAEREANKAAKAKLAEYEAQIQAFKDKDKTESEKEAERLQALEKSNSENARKALQYEVAAEKGIPLKLAARLHGADKDAMLADADELLPLIQQTKPNIPKPDKSQGRGGKPKPASLSAAIAGHLK